MAQSRTLNLILEALKEFGEKSFGIAELGTEVLWKLTKYADKASLVEIGTSQNCNYLCVIMLNYMFSHKTVPIYIAHVIQSMTNKILENKATFHEIGVIRQLLQTIKHHREDECVVSAVSGALRSLSYYPPSTSSLNESGFCDDIPNYLIKFQKFEEIISHVLGIVANMVSLGIEGQASLDHFGENKICEIVLGCVKMYRDKPDKIEEWAKKKLKH